MRPKLPVAIDMRDWLQLIKDRPNTVHLAALAFYNGSLHVSAWVWNRVVVVPVTDLARLDAILDDADKATLRQWVARINDGAFAADARAEADRLAFTW
jgi:hypothetical protein